MNKGKEEKEEDLRIKRKLREYEKEALARLEDILGYIEKQKKEANKESFLVWIDMKYALCSAKEEIENQIRYLKKRIHDIYVNEEKKESKK